MKTPDAATMILLAAAAIGFGIVARRQKQSCREAALRRCQELYGDDKFRRDSCLRHEDLQCRIESGRMSTL